MGVHEFDAWCDVTQRQAKQQASPERWDAEDPWFKEQHRKRSNA